MRERMESGMEGSTGKGKRKRGRLRTCFLALGLLILVCGSFLLSGYDSLDFKVFDDAKLLDGEEEAALQEDIVRLAGEMEMDIVIVTTSDAQGKSAEEYADDFYDEGKFGYDTDGETGILLLIDMDHRECYISTAGYAIEAFTDGEIDQMLDDIVSCLGAGEYYQACAVFLSGITNYGNNSQEAGNGFYNPDTERFEEYTREELEKERESKRRQAVIMAAFTRDSILTHLGISAVIGAVSLLIMVLSVNNHKAVNGRAYVRPGSEQLRNHSDVKVNTTVVTRVIEKPHEGRTGQGGNHSTVHTSRSGSSHGGGGRRF